MKRLTALSKPLLRFAPEETEAGRKEILGANLGRLIYLLYVGVPLMAAELTLISYKFSGATGQVLQWRTGATTIHFILLIFNLITGAGILFIRKKNLAEKPLVKIIPHFVFIYFITAGIAFTTVDQLITSAITPFVITCLISAMVLIISPFITAIYYTLAYIAFYLAISRMQLPPGDPYLQPDQRFHLNCDRLGSFGDFMAKLFTAFQNGCPYQAAAIGIADSEQGTESYGK